MPPEGPWVDFMKKFVEENQSPWVEVRPHIWLNKDTALFHFEDETNNFDETGYLTPDDAEAALKEYCILQLGVPQVHWIPR